MGDTINIVTNNVPRDILQGWDLTVDERKEFDFIDWSKVEAGESSPEFYRYRGEVYYLESEGIPSFAPSWDGYTSDSFFSGMLYRYPVENGQADYERIVIGRFYVS